MKYIITLNGRTYEVEVERGGAEVIDEYDVGCEPKTAARAAAPAPKAAPAPAPKAAPAPAPKAAPAPAPAPKAAPAPAPAAGDETIVSPMPGTVLDVKVAQGASVKCGDTLVILEAMKMENEIVAPRDGVVKQVVSAKGASVDTGAPLVILA